jgi:hypothetical protein
MPGRCSLDRLQRGARPCRAVPGLHPDRRVVGTLGGCPHHAAGPGRGRFGTSFDGTIAPALPCVGGGLSKRASRGPVRSVGSPKINVYGQFSIESPADPSSLSGPSPRSASPPGIGPSRRRGPVLSRSCPGSRSRSSRPPTRTLSYRKRPATYRPTKVAEATCRCSAANATTRSPSTRTRTVSPASYFGARSAAGSTCPRRSRPAKYPRQTRAGRESGPEISDTSDAEETRRRRRVAPTPRACDNHAWLCHLQG